MWKQRQTRTGNVLNWRLGREKYSSSKIFPQCPFWIMRKVSLNSQTDLKINAKKEENPFRLGRKRRKANISGGLRGREKKKVQHLESQTSVFDFILRKASKQASKQCNAPPKRNEMGLSN